MIRSIPRPDWRLLLGLGLLTFLAWMLLSGVANAQTTPVVNPTRAEFAASADHNAVDRTVPVVSSYELRVFAQANQDVVVKAQDLGKPAPDSTGKITVPITTIIAALPVGDYVARVVSKGPGGESNSDPSNPFILRVRVPAAAGTPTVIR